MASASAPFDRGDLPAIETIADTWNAAGTSLVAAYVLNELAKRLLDLSVAVERDRGTTWAEIGSALGITRSSAHDRFADAASGKYPEPEETAWRVWQEIAELTGQAWEARRWTRREPAELSEESTYGPPQMSEEDVFVR